MILDQIQPPTEEEMATASGVAKGAAKGWDRYKKTSRRRAEVISELLAERYGDDLRPIRVLDWGAGVGGVAVAMAERCGAEIWAADVDHPAIEWLARSVPEINTEKLEPGAPLPFADAEFDAIYGISILTHIPPELQAFYVSEIRRALKPDGLALITVKSYEAVERAQNDGMPPDRHPMSREELDEAGVYYRSYPEKLKSGMAFAQEHDYGITYHSSAAIDELFSSMFHVENTGEHFIGRQRILRLSPK